MRGSASGDICIVTGASGGLGQALAMAAAKRGQALVLVGRADTSLNAVRAGCETAGSGPIASIMADLGTSAGVDHACFTLGDGLLSDYRKVVLFNCASTIDPIESFANLTFADMERALNVNVSAAVALSSTMVKLSQASDIDEIAIMNISSGVSINPVIGWSAYCISKAALNMVTRCIATETASALRPVYALAINPGALDTRMQERIRTADKNKSPATEKFNRMHLEGKLKRPENVAEQIFEILASRKFASGEFVDFNLFK